MIPTSAITNTTAHLAKRAARKVALLSKGYSDNEIERILDHLDDVDSAYWENRKQIREDYLRQDELLMRDHAETIKQALEKRKP